MENLQFDADTHTYTLDGKVIPSVTQLTEIYSTTVLEEDSDLELTFEMAAERGTFLHGYLEHCLAGGDPADYEIPDAYSGYVDAINLFLAEHELEPMLIETPMHCTDCFAGTPDYIGNFDGKLAILDWKFVSQVQKTKVGAQLNGYCIMAGRNDIYVEKLYCVQFLASGQYRLYPVENDSRTFDLCWDVYQAKNMKHPKGEIRA